MGMFLSHFLLNFLSFLLTFNISLGNETVTENKIHYLKYGNVHVLLQFLHFELFLNIKKFPLFNLQYFSKILLLFHPVILKAC